MVWVKRRFVYDEYKPYLETVQRLASDYPDKDFVMTSKRFSDAHLSEYFIGVSDASFTTNFHDFEPVDQSQLPSHFDNVLFGDRAKLSEVSAADFAVRD